MLQIETLIVGPFQSNCSIVACTETGDAIIVDAGAEGTRILETVRKLGVTVKAVVNTHAHLDHVSGLADVVEALGVPVFMHNDEMPIYDQVELQAAMFGLPAPRRVAIHRFLVGGDTVHVGKHSAAIFLAPGHSPGSICLHFADESPPRVISGDVLFQGSVGRTDLPGGDYDTLIESLRTQFLPLAGETVVHPGHGPLTTIAEEKRTNPFLAPLVVR